MKSIVLSLFLTFTVFLLSGTAITSTGYAQSLQDDTIGPATGQSARTIYDYQAENENEISFDVDEIITDIEQVDAGWWRGVRQLDNSYGLFPANYVELID